MTVDHIMQTGLILASITLAIFCVSLSRRLRRLNDLESGLGGAIAVMSAEVDRLEKAIIAARDEATAASDTLREEVATAKRERALWDLQRKLDEAASAGPAAQAQRRLRKRMAADDT